MIHWRGPFVNSTIFATITIFLLFRTAFLNLGARRSYLLSDPPPTFSTTQKACTASGSSCLLQEAEFSPQTTSVLLTSTQTNVTELKTKDSPGASLVTLNYRELKRKVIDINDTTKGLFIYKEPYHLQNIGHLLGDDIWAIFSALYDHNLQSILASDIWMILPGEFEEEVKRRSIISQHYRLVSTNPILFLRGQTTNHIVYEKLLTGWDGYGYSMGYIHKTFPNPEKVAAFRRRALILLDLKESELQGRCNVLFLEKNVQIAHHKYSISNIDELMKALRATTACTIEKVSWHGMSLRDQIAKIHDKSIVISLPGSDMMNCIFQPTHSGIIVPDQCNEVNVCTGSNEVNLWFGRLPTRIVYTLPAVNNGLIWNGNRAFWNATHFVETVVNMNKLLQS